MGTDLTFIVKRMPLIYNTSECQVLNFTDISTYKRLKQKEESNNLLKTLNASVHHEMIAPLKTNLAMTGRLLRILKDPQ